MEKKGDRMNQLESAFAEYFSNWNILLPVDAVATRQPGRIQEKGWVIEYLFGVDGDDEYLDFYASHRHAPQRPAYRTTYEVERW